MKLKTTIVKLTVPVLLFLSFFIFFRVHNIMGAEVDSLLPQKRFSIKLRNAEVIDVLRMMSREFGFNLIFPENVTGKVTIDFHEVGLKEALETILSSSSLWYVQIGNIIRVDSQEKIKNEADFEIERKKNLISLEPLITKSIQLNYISKTGGKEGDKSNGLEDFKTSMEQLLTKRDGTGITVINDTQTLVIRDIEKNVEKIISMIKELDTPTKQIKMNARIVEVEGRDSLDLGITWGGKIQEDSKLTFPNKSIITGKKGIIQDGGRDVPQTTNVKDGTVVNLPSVVSMGGLLDVTIGNMMSTRLDLALQALEQKRKINIISKPSVMVTQNQEAEIHVGSEVPVLKGRDLQTGQVIISYEKIGVKLTIVPQITKENNVFMKVQISKSEKGDKWQIAGQTYDTISSKNVTTQVLVNDRETVVIGGLTSKGETLIKNEVPFFSKIPFLGLLFKSKSTEEITRELIIFITPEIIQL